MKEQTAQNLANTLSALENARENLENADSGSKAAAADMYMKERAASSPIFAQAQSEYDLDQAGASTPGAEPEEQLPTEAAPGVPLLAPPGIVVHAENIERYGQLQPFWSKSDPTAPPIMATPYAFAPGTAVKTEEGEVATAQNSRIIRSKVETEVLAVISQDEFDAAFTAVDPATAQPAQGQGEGAPAPGEPAADTPVSGAFERDPNAPAPAEPEA